MKGTEVAPSFFERAIAIMAFIMAAMWHAVLLIIHGQITGSALKILAGPAAIVVTGIVGPEFFPADRPEISEMPAMLAWAVFQNTAWFITGVELTREWRRAVSRLARKDATSARSGNSEDAS